MENPFDSIKEPEIFNRNPGFYCKNFIEHNGHLVDRCNCPSPCVDQCSTCVDVIIEHHAKKNNNGITCLMLMVALLLTNCNVMLNPSPRTNDVYICKYGNCVKRPAIVKFDGSSFTFYSNEYDIHISKLGKVSNHHYTGVGTDGIFYQVHFPDHPTTLIEIANNKTVVTIATTKYRIQYRKRPDSLSGRYYMVTK